MSTKKKPSTSTTQADANASTGASAPQGTPSAGDSAAGSSLGSLLQSLGISAVPGAATTGAQIYLGVPNNFIYSGGPAQTGANLGFQLTGGATLPGQLPTPPKYKVGDEFSLAGMSPESIARLQQSMVAAGLIGAHSVIRTGIADPTTVAAYKTLLGFANQNGTDANTAMATLLSSPAKTATPVQPVAANPLDSDQALRSAAQDQLGHAPTLEQLQGFEAAYNAQYENAQMAAPTDSNPSDQVNPDGSGNSTDTGVDVTPQTSTKRQMQAPSADAAATQYLQQTDQQGIAQQNVATKYGTLLDILGGNPASSA